MSSTEGSSAETPVEPGDEKNVKFIATDSDASDAASSKSTLPVDIHGLFSSIKKRSHSQRHELKKKYAEDVHNLAKKYHQVKEQLRVQQELMENRESSEKFLQDQLNKATIELAQLRLVRDDLNSSLKQATAQIQYLTRELEKQRVATAKDEHERQMDVVQMQEQLTATQQQLEKLKSENQIAHEKWKAERAEWKAQLAAARKAYEESQDQNFQITNEARTMQTQYESEKTEYIRAQQRLAELQMKYGGVSDTNIRLREENEKLKDTVAALTEESQTVKLELEKTSHAKQLLEAQNKAISEDLKEKTTQLSQLETETQKTQARLDSMTDELKQNRRMMEKAKQNFSVEVDALRQALCKERSVSEGMKEEHQHLIDEFNEQTREYKLEKAFREKAQASEGQLRQRVSQTESMMAELENERVALTQQLQESHEEIEAKNELIEENEKKLRKANKESLLLSEQLKEAQRTIEELSMKITDKSLEDLENENADLRAQNQTYAEQLRMQQAQLRDLQLDYERVCSEKQGDVKAIDELNESLKKERENMKTAMLERKEARKKNKLLRKDVLDLKGKVSALESELSLAKAENSHLTDLCSERQAMVAKLSQEKADINVKYNQCAEELRDEKAAHSLLASENDSLRTENSNLARQMGDMKLSEKSLKERLQSLEDQAEELKQKAITAEQESEGLRNEIADVMNSYQQAKDQLLEERDHKEKAIIKCHGLTANSQATLDSMKQLDAQLLQAQEQLSDKSKALTEAQLQVEQLRDMNEHLNQENEALANDKARQFSKLQELEQQLKEELEEKDGLRQQLTDEIQGTLDQLRIEKDAMTERTEVAEAKLKEAQEHISELQEVINGLQEESQLVERKANDAENRIFSLQRTISEHEASIKALQLQNQDQAEALSQLRDEKKILKDQADTLEQRHVLDRLEQESVFNSNLEAMKAKFTSEQDESLAHNQQQKDQIKSLEQEKNELLKENRQIKRQAALLAAKYKSLSERADNLDAQKEELLKENRDLKANLITHVQSFGQLDEQNKKLTKEKTKLLDKIQTLAVENEELGEGQTDMLAMRSKLNQTQNEMRQLEMKLATVTDLNESLKREVAAAESAREQAAKEFEDITETIKQIHGLLRPSSDSEAAMNTAAMSERLMNELSVLRAFLISSQSDIETLIRERDSLLGEVNGLKASAKKLAKAQKEGKNELALAIKKQEHAERELRLLKENKDKYNQERANLYDGIEKLRTALQMTKESLQASEAEKNKLKDDKMKLRILLEHVRDIHNVEIAIPV